MGRSGRSLSLAALFAAGPSLRAQDPDWETLRTLLDVPVISASKAEQSGDTAPAKVVVISEADIRARGYTDFEQIFHDLAGFDISRGRGVEWSTLFMRGIRTENTDRFLLIWDGVIQNDVWKANVWISRQYPLLNIERIEVMYGPSSLLYGANAFSGIVNVILKKPKDVDGFVLQTGKGSYNARWAELNYGQVVGTWRFMANARVFRSDEFDVNGKYWVDNAGRRRYYNLEYPRDYIPAGSPGSSIVLDPATGLPTRMKNGERVLFDGKIHQDTDDWFIQAGVGRGGFKIGAFYWFRNEVEDTWYAATNRRDGPWVPTGGAIQATWDHALGNGWSARHYAIMRTSGVDGDLSYDRSHQSTVDNNPANPVPIKVSNVRPQDYQALFNREYRVGTQWNFDEEGLSLVTGLEHTRTKNYGDYNVRVLSTDPWRSNTPGDHLRTEGNLAWYGQAQMDLRPFSLAGGLRYDYNWIVGEPGGFHHLFTGRMAGIYAPKERHVLKLIYGQAFQAPSSWHRFATTQGSRDYPNPNLKPERLTSFELVYEFKPTSHWKNSLSVYHTQVTDIIRAKDSRHQNLGRVDVVGLEAESAYHFDVHNSLHFNVTTNSAKFGDTGRPTGDIAPWKANLGWTARLKHTWGLSLRGHYIARRDTVSRDFAPPASYFAVRSIPGRFTLDLTLSARDLMKGLDLTLTAFNIANRTYYDPGLREADGKKYNGAILQPGANAFLAVTYRF